MSLTRASFASSVSSSCSFQGIEDIATSLPQTDEQQRGNASGTHAFTVPLNVNRVWEHPPADFIQLFIFSQVMGFADSVALLTIILGALLVFLGPEELVGHLHGPVSSLCSMLTVLMNHGQAAARRLYAALVELENMGRVKIVGDRAMAGSTKPPPTEYFIRDRQIGVSGSLIDTHDSAQGEMPQFFAGKRALRFPFSSACLQTDRHALIARIGLWAVSYGMRMHSVSATLLLRLADFCMKLVNLVRDRLSRRPSVALGLATVHASLPKLLSWLGVVFGNRHFHFAIAAAMVIVLTAWAARLELTRAELAWRRRWEVMEL